MFKAKRPVFRGFGGRRGVLPKAAALLAALSASALGGCALEPREGDGLNADWRDVTIMASTTGSTPPPTDGGTTAVCKQTAMFTQIVLPLLTAKHEGTGPADMPPPGPQACIDCHDGTKLKAVVAMLIDSTKPEVTCPIALARELSKHDILASSNPGRPDVVHDFKFVNIEDYNRFRDGLVMWLSAEGVTPTQ
jgi:hypothetical protein